MIAEPILYGVFALVVIVLLAVDLLVVHRDPHAVTIREAATWTGIWVAVSVAFGLLIPLVYDGGTTGSPTAEFFTGYVIEKSLSVDNVFLFLLIFSVLAVPKHLQHRVLFYGVLGAIVMRTILIFAGVALIDRFEWLLYVFGGVPHLRRHPNLPAARDPPRHLQLTDLPTHPTDPADHR